MSQCDIVTLYIQTNYVLLVFVLSNMNINTVVVVGLVKLVDTIIVVAVVVVAIV